MTSDKLISIKIIFLVIKFNQITISAISDLIQAVFKEL